MAGIHTLDPHGKLVAHGTVSESHHTLSVSAAVWLGTEHVHGLSDIWQGSDRLCGVCRYWKECTRQAHMSGLQRGVSNVLQAMGVAHENEYLADNGLFSVDIALLEAGPGSRACLEVDGPFHFANNCHQPLGHTMLRSAHSANTHTLRGTKNQKKKPNLLA